MLLLQSQATIGSSETEPGLLLGVHSLQVSLGHGHYNVLLQRSHCLLITSITIVICQWRKGLDNQSGRGLIRSRTNGLMY